MFHLRRLRGSGGFSLLELLVVLAILAIMALAVAPWFLKVSQRNQVRNAAQEVAITLAAARMRAVKRNLPARVLITPPTGPDLYTRVETFEQLTPTPLKVGEVKLSPEVSFPTSGVFYNNRNPNEVIFQPDGRLGGGLT